MASVDAITIRLAGAYRIQWLDRLVRDLGPLVALKTSARVTVDLSGLVAVSPSALALVTAVLTKARADGVFDEGSVLVFPSSPPVRNYLMRMDLVRVVMPDTETTEPFVRNPPLGFRPCREFVSAEECRAVARDLTEALGERCATDEVAHAAIRIA
ncbi:MAG: hypothetical protein H0U90_09435 [Actinobacteria bacterium]|nr:hypothetical protein [Actinomycetota bacterium]MDQ3380340.1 hypothetical protein [Actinomycetota bacterium]